jgi:D-lactate dehydrogenase (cytochrome)
VSAVQHQETSGVADIQAILPELKQRYGDRVSTGLAVREQHGRGESHHATRPPDVVVFPQSTEEASAVVKLCAAHGVPIVPFGAGTSLEGNVSAVRGGVCIDLSGMNRILRVSPEDLDCTVEAGVTRKQLNEDLRDTGLFFPVDPGANATIGGMAATRASGTNAVRYGTMRESVISLKVVLADGRIINTARRARKSAAGYDLTRLFVGSEGTLGIITEVTLKLSGIPEIVGVVVCTFPDVRSAVDATVAVIQCGVPVARVELLDDAQMDAINRFTKTNHPVMNTLFFEFHGTPASVKEQTAQVEQLVREFGGTDFRAADAPEERTALWQARHDAFYATVALRPGSQGWASDVCVPISRLAECIDAAKTALAGSSVPATIVGHVGDGNFHVVFSVMTDNPEEMAEVERLNSVMVQLALSVDGTCTGEHGVGTGKIKYLDAEHGEAVSVMRLLKEALDPAGILNPGKILPPALPSRELGGVTA